jgi:hypothetical protein
MFAERVRPLETVIASEDKLSQTTPTPGPSCLLTNSFNFLRTTQANVSNNQQKRTSGEASPQS